MNHITKQGPILSLSVMKISEVVAVSISVALRSSPSARIRSTKNCSVSSTTLSSVISTSIHNRLDDEDDGVKVRLSESDVKSEGSPVSERKGNELSFKCVWSYYPAVPCLVVSVTLLAIALLPFRVTHILCWRPSATVYEIRNMPIVTSADKQQQHQTHHRVIADS